MYRILLALILFFTCGYTDETTSRSIPYVDLEGEPSSIVGSVNVISGRYADSSVDLIVPGAEPIILERFCASFSGNTKKDLFRKGWVFNCLGTLRRVVDSESPLEDRYFVQDSSGFGAEYESKWGQFVLPKDALGYGMTNCATGNISARSNVRNHRLSVEESEERLRPKNDTPTLFTGSGDFQVFRRRKEKYPMGDYDLWMERKPCGNMVEYTYEKNGRPIQIRSLNKYNQTIGTVNLEYKFDHGICVIARGGGKKTKYTYVKDDLDYQLTSIEKDGGWVEKLSHDGTFRKELPGKRILECEFYSRGLNQVGLANVTLRREDERIGRVKCVKATVGIDATPVITHQFFYHLNVKKNNDDFTILNGVTGVINALGHKTDYVFDGHQRLSAIVQFQVGTPFSIQNFHWESEGNLGRVVNC